MNSKAAALRFEVESVLAGRHASPFQYRDRWVAETVPAGIPSIDDLTGGLPRGGLTEIYGPPCSGKTSFLISALASRTAASEVCALVDARDAFDPRSAETAGVRLNQLAWVRCRNADQALRATDLLIQGGGFGLIALDLCDLPLSTVRRIPLTTWFRFRRAVEHTPTILLALERRSIAGSCSSLLIKLGLIKLGTAGNRIKELEASQVPEPAHARLLTRLEITAEVMRSRVERKPAGSISVTFARKTAWAG